jgi:hypothetical protein
MLGWQATKALIQSDLRVGTRGTLWLPFSGIENFDQNNSADGRWVYCNRMALFSGSKT